MCGNPPEQYIGMRKIQGFLFDTSSPLDRLLGNNEFHLASPVQRSSVSHRINEMRQKGMRKQHSASYILHVLYFVSFAKIVSKLFKLLLINSQRHVSGGLEEHFKMFTLILYVPSLSSMYAKYEKYFYAQIETMHPISGIKLPFIVYDQRKLGQTAVTAPTDIYLRFYIGFYFHVSCRLLRRRTKF